MSQQIQTVARTTLYRDPQFFSAFPAVVPVSDGGFLLAFRRAPDDRQMLAGLVDTLDETVDHVHPRSHIAALRLDAKARAAGDVYMLPADAVAADQDANLHRLPSGRLLQYGFLWRPVPPEVMAVLKEKGHWAIKGFHHQDGHRFLPWGGYVRASDDDGHTWGPRGMLPPPHWGAGFTPLEGQGGWTFLRGRMAGMSDGSLRLAAYGPGPEPGNCVSLYRSEDAGRSWTAFKAAHGFDGQDLSEPALALWSGRLTAFCRTRSDGDYVGCLYPDAAERSHLSGIVGHPADPLVLSDGRLFLAYGYRHKPYGVRARIVSPDQPFEDAPETVLVDDMPGPDCGYPWSVELSDSRVLTVFYGADARGIRGIEAVISVLA